MSQQINLYNPAFAPKRDFASLSIMAVSCAICLAIVTVVNVSMSARISAVQRQLVKETADRQVAQAEMTRLATELSSRKPDLELTNRLTRLEEGLASRKEVMRTLHAGAIGDIQGFSAHFEAFARQTLTGLWLTRLKVARAGQDVVLEGRAVRPQLVPGYLKRLNGEEVMQGHAFSSLEMKRSDGSDDDEHAAPPNYIEFRLSTLPTSVDVQPEARK